MCYRCKQQARVVRLNSLILYRRLIALPCPSSFAHCVWPTSRPRHTARAQTLCAADVFAFGLTLYELARGAEHGPLPDDGPLWDQVAAGGTTQSSHFSCLKK
jgi:hypothetical protein